MHPLQQWTHVPFQCYSQLNCHSSPRHDAPFQLVTIAPTPQLRVPIAQAATLASPTPWSPSLKMMNEKMAQAHAWVLGIVIGNNAIDPTFLRHMVYLLSLQSVWKPQPNLIPCHVLTLIQYPLALTIDALLASHHVLMISFKNPFQPPNISPVLVATQLKASELAPSNGHGMMTWDKPIPFSSPTPIMPPTQHYDFSVPNIGCRPCPHINGIPQSVTPQPL